MDRHKGCMRGPFADAHGPINPNDDTILIGCYFHYLTAENYMISVTYTHRLR